MKTRAKMLHQLEKPLYLRHWLNAKHNTEKGNARPCFCVDAAQVQKEEGFSDDQAAYIAGTVLEAGSDTTSNSLYPFIQAMVVFPEVQKQAQEAVDRVCSEDKPPTMEDEPNIPYIRACIKETLRWMPTTPTGGVPRAVTEDDNYMGYTIPKGAGVMISTWTIHMNPERYPEPRRFDPDRFKGDLQTASEAAANPDVTKRDHFAFGSGRRICPGMHVAERSLFLGMSRLLWAFDFLPKLDAESKPIIPDIENLTQGFVIRPEEFPAVIRPRSQKRAEVVEREWKIVQELLDQDTKQWRSSATSVF
jgi:cytochrome P450